MDDKKLAPYKRLRTILKDGDEILTDNGEKNLNKLLGITEDDEKGGFLLKVSNFFKKIDNKIFRKSSKISNVYSKRPK